MAELSLGPYRLRVDLEATRAYYAAHPLPWVTCGCAGCRNFVEAVKQLPGAAAELFASLGLDPEKPGETMYFEGTPEAVDGAGWYHLCGTILEAPPVKPGETFGAWLPVAEHWEAAFKEDCDLLPDDFPRPCFQMDLCFRLPWVLEEANPYTA